MATGRTRIGIVAALVIALSVAVVTVDAIDRATDVGAATTTLKPVADTYVDASSPKKAST